MPATMFQHMLRFLVRDHRLDALDEVETLIDRRVPDDALVPSYTALCEHHHDTDAWHALYGAFAVELVEAHGPMPGLATMVKLQTALMPARGRTFPQKVMLDHDVVAWDRDHEAGRGRPLVTYPPAELEVRDPWGLCQRPVARWPSPGFELCSVLTPQGEALAAE